MFSRITSDVAWIVTIVFILRQVIEKFVKRIFIRQGIDSADEFVRRIKGDAKPCILERNKRK